MTSVRQGGEQCDICQAEGGGNVTSVGQGWEECDRSERSHYLGVV